VCQVKCARLEMTLVESCNKRVREAAPVLKTGRKWSAKKSVVEAKALKIGDIVGQVQHGRGVLGSVYLLLNGTRQAQLKGGSWKSTRCERKRRG